MNEHLQKLATNTELEFRFGNLSDLDAILDAFYRDRLEPGPLFSATGVTQPDVLPVATSWLQHMLPQGLTWLALDRGRIVGLGMGEDFSNPWRSAGVALAPAIAPCIALLDRITHEYHATCRPPPGHTLNIVVLKVRKDYTGRHVTKTFMVDGVPAMRERGFKKVIGILSGAKSQHLARARFGFEIEAEIKYADFEFEGRRPFAGITETDGIKVMGGWMIPEGNR
jgi:hypothetical protein